MRVSRIDKLAVGNKAANLGELARIGLPVPDGFVLTNDILGYLPGTALDVIVPMPDPQRRLF